MVFYSQVKEYQRTSLMGSRYEITRTQAKQSHELRTSKVTVKETVAQMEVSLTSKEVIPLKEVGPTSSEVTSTAGEMASTSSEVASTSSETSTSSEVASTLRVAMSTAGASTSNFENLSTLAATSNDV